MDRKQKESSSRQSKMGPSHRQISVHWEKTSVWFSSRRRVARPQFLRSGSEWKLWGWIWLRGREREAGESSVERKRMEDEEARVWAPIVPGVSTYKRHYGRAAVGRFRPDKYYSSYTHAYTELLEKDDWWSVI